MALTEKARLAATALAVGATQEGAARAAQVNVRTVRTWVTRVEFRAEVARLTDEIVARSIARKVGMLARADSRLRKLIADPDPRVATRAVKIAYESLISMRNHGEVKAKLEEIQEAIRHGHGGEWDGEADDDGDEVGTGDATGDAPEG